MRRSGTVIGLLALISCFRTAPLAAADQLAGLEAGPSTPFRISGKGVINDATHPVRPGNFRPLDAAIRIAVDPGVGEASVEIETTAGAEKDVDRYFFRRGRIFQVDDKGQEIPPESLANVSPAAVAALHPALVAIALLENRQNLRPEGAGTYAFASNDALWAVATDAKAGRVLSLERRDFSEVYGDGTEEVLFERSPDRVTIRRGGREAARFEFGPAEPAAAAVIPAGDARRDRGHILRAGDVTFSEAAPHVFTIDLASLNSRVVVAEFADYVAVIEGAYSPRIGDVLVRAVRERFGKPIRYHAFSHLHGQYIGSARSYVAEGATIVVPPTTAPLIEEIAAAPHALEPDALSRGPRPPKIQAVKTSLRLEDATNALEVFNVVSEHTDEYFVFWFPGPRILVTGDLLFYRPGKPLAGRSKRVCRTVSEIGLNPDRYVATWPLEGAGTRNVVTGEEMRAACGPVTRLP